ncbi:hypothetical protein QBC34DRAFT_458925 [Podospora aff. communis PSN243]|uniref:Extracellular membrane protein CFEM domain-containing protein n=1 Tax=Podospora aff. communis PSN243 TaxID=3040156 RepID=A0AAV9GSP4_9PEZI|nr:hypothetical protein QBC34DRAFT_458925 [Podospora aff. communis PSN243]
MARTTSTWLLLLATAMVQIQLTLATVVSIRDEPAFKAMRECARDCLVWNGSIDLIGELGCVYPYQNECLCRPDLASAASKHLSTCGSTYCTVGPASGDISTAIGLYNSYCVANGFDVTAVAAVAPKTTLATQTNQGSGSTNGATVGQQAGNGQPATTGQSDPSATPGSSGATSGLSTGAMIGIIASVCSVVVGLLGLAVKIYFGRKKARRDQHQQDKLDN